MRKKEVLHVHNDEKKVSKTITITSYRETNRVLEIRNRNIMRRTPSLRPIRQSGLAKTSNDQKVSQHPQKCGSFIPSILTASDMPAPILRSVSPTSSTHQTKEK